MRTSRTFKKRLRKAIFITAAIVASPYLIQGALALLPIVNTATQKATVISAGFVMPEGAKSAKNSVTSTLTISEPAVTSSETKQISSSAVSNTEAAAAQGAMSSKALSSSRQTSSKITKPKNAGTIIRQAFGASGSSIYISLGNNAYIKNVTKLSNSKVKQAADKKPEFTMKCNGTPEVLIMHTHTTEGYEPTTSKYFDKNYNSRTKDSKRNVVYVGDKIETELLKKGIGVLHDTTIHDYPSYTGAYDRSAETVKKYLKKYPSIKVVLDVHRDAMHRDDNTRLAPAVKINGKSAAQVMIISGCDDGTMNMPDYLKNLSFSSLLLKQAQSDYNNLMRPTLFDYRFYNQNLTTGSILLEMGSDSNSLEEAAYSGTLIGKSLAKALISLKK